MAEHELEILFPDNYEFRVQIQRIEYEITLLNISSLCHTANQQFEYFASNKKKSGLYFVDWRINYWNLNDFILINENVESGGAIEAFSLNFKESGYIMSQRFEVEKEVQVDKNSEYSSSVVYIPSIQIDGMAIKKEEIIFAEFITKVDDPILNQIPNAEFIRERSIDNEIHIIYPLHDKARSEERSRNLENTLIKDYSFNYLFNSLQINTNREFSLLQTLYNKIYNSKLIEIFQYPVIDQNQFVNEILKDSNGYLVFHHQLELIIKQVFKCSDEDALLHRRNWNKKIIDKIRSWKEIEFDKGRSLYDLIVSKALLKNAYPQLITYHPTYLFI